MKGALIGALVAVLITGCASSAKQYGSPAEWVAESNQGSQLPLGTKAGEWSGAKRFNLKSGGNVDVKSEFVKHHGSTCHFNLKFTNVGQSQIQATAGLTTQERVNIYPHNSGRLNLKPGASVTYNDLEARECPIIFGTSMDMNGCAACKAWILFAE